MTEISSEVLRTAQDRYKHREVTLERDGKEITVTEKVLWDEVFHLGTTCQAAQILKEKHPEVFQNFADQDKAAGELKKFCIQAFDIDYTKMSLSHYMKMTEGMFQVMFDERTEKKS